MLRDLGSRDRAFIETVAGVRRGLLAVAGVVDRTGDDAYEAVLMQGSGTFGIESVIGSTMPPDGKLLVIVGGAYGRRIAEIARRLRIETATIDVPESELPDPNAVERALAGDPSIRMVAIVHCETTTGILHPVQEIGSVVHSHGRRYFVDSMSAFGAVPLDLRASHVDYLVSSANKCIEGVPGFSFAICRRSALVATEGWARSVSLDLLAQWKGLESNGQFRFTPPTHAILAFAEALRELEAEGGVEGRAARYRRNYECIARGMQRLGFEEYVPRERQGYIISSFRYPQDPRFDFDEFYERLSDLGYVIYPGKVSDADCFRIGHIGRLYERDMEALIRAIQAVLAEMGVNTSGDGRS